MNSISVIPTPPAQRWRELRLNVIPVLVVTGALAASVSIWKDHVASPSLIGEVETIQANVTSSQAGSLIHLRVTRFQKVSAGDPIAEVITTDPKILEATLAVIRAEVDLLRAGMDPLVARQRAEVDFEQLRLDWMSQRVDLATARVNLQQAENEFQRVSQLHKENLVSEDEFDLKRAARDVLQVQVEGKEKLVTEIGDHLDELDLNVRFPSDPTLVDPVQAAISVQDEKLRLAEAQLSPITLTASIDGQVSMVYRQTADNIVAGESIVTIRALRAKNIIGYLPQPVQLEPEQGMTVKIRTRSPKREAATSQIVEVGAQMEPISQPLLRPGISFEMGLPILISLPSQLQVRPGELVELTLVPNAN